MTLHPQTVCMGDVARRKVHVKSLKHRVIFLKDWFFENSQQNMRQHAYRLQQVQPGDDALMNVLTVIAGRQTVCALAHTRRSELRMRCEYIVLASLSLVPVVVRFCSLLFAFVCSCWLLSVFIGWTP